MNRRLLAIKNASRNGTAAATFAAASLASGTIGSGGEPGPDTARGQRVARAPAQQRVGRPQDAVARLGSTRNSPLASAAIAPAGQRIPVGQVNGFGQTIARSVPAILALPPQRSWVPGGRNPDPFARGAGPGMNFAVPSLMRAQNALNIQGQTSRT